MSGKPYPNGVGNLLDALRRFNTSQEYMEVLMKEINERKVALEQHAKARDVAAADIETLRKEMDIYSPGNMGYEDRLLWTLREMTRQAERYGRTHP